MFALVHDSVNDLRYVNYRALLSVLVGPKRRPTHHEFTAELTYLILPMIIFGYIADQVQALMGMEVYNNLVRICATARNVGSDFYSGELMQRATLNDCTRHANSLISYLRPFGIVALIMLLLAYAVYRVSRIAILLADTTSDVHHDNQSLGDIVTERSISYPRFDDHSSTGTRPVDSVDMSYTQQEIANRHSNMLIRGLVAIAFVAAFFPSIVFVLLELLRLLEFVGVLIYTALNHYTPTGTEIKSNIHDSIPLPLNRLGADNGFYNLPNVNQSNGGLDSYGSGHTLNPYLLCNDIGGYYSADIGGCVYN